MKNKEKELTKKKKKR